MDSRTVREIGWRADLDLLLEQLDVASAASKVADALQRSIVTVFDSYLLHFRSEMSAEEGLRALEQHGSHFALVQDESDTLSGVLRYDVLNDIRRHAPEQLTLLSVDKTMDRNFCVEPDSVTIRDVVNRFTLGFSNCIVIINRLGQPVGIVSPSVLLRALRALFNGEMGTVEGRGMLAAADAGTSVSDAA